MKNILFCLLLLAGFAAANTCTEAWFYIRNPVFLLIPQNAPYIDSAYFKEGTEVTFFKASYRDGHIDKTYQGLIWENYGSGITDIAQYYVSRDESVLSKKDSEVLLSDSTFGDTTYLERMCYYNGKISQKIFHKTTNSYASSFSTEDSYRKGSNGTMESFSWEELTEFFFRNDSLIKIDTSNFSPDGSPTNQITYYIEDPEDDYKCYEYKNDSLTGTLTYQKKERGYSLKYFNQDIFQEYFMVIPDAITAIRKLRPTVKISPKARYFDLLGRYKFTK